LRFLVLAWVMCFQTANLDQAENLIANNPDAAEKVLLKAVGESETEAKASLLLCHLYTDKGDYEKALPHGKRAVELLPQDSRAHFYYAVAIRQKMSNSTFFAMSNTGKYKKLLNKAIELDAHNYDAYEEKFGFFMNAPAIAGGGVDHAEELAEELVKVNRERGLVLQWQVHGKKSEPAKRLDIAQTLVGMAPEKIRYQFFKGFSLQGLDRNDEAADFFESLYQNHPEELGALYQAARSRILGKFDQHKAVTLLDTYIEKADEKTQPSRAAAHWRAGMALEQMGEFEEAIKRYERSLELEPDFENAKKALKKLKKRV